MVPAAPRRPPLRPVAGFEATGYAWAGRRLVWVGRAGRTEPARIDHPRNWHRPWRPPTVAYPPAALREGAAALLARPAELPSRGLLCWLQGHALPFPLQLATRRLDVLRRALEDNDVQALAAVAPALLGLGPGLTPSGDDLLGGVFFGLAHAPRRGWSRPLAVLQRGLRRQARAGDTNPISAALLHDLMRGQGYRALHELLAALATDNRRAVDAAAAHLLQLGASSGADLLCGLLITLASTPDPAPPRRPRRIHPRQPT